MSSYVAVVPQIGRYGERETLLVHLPNRGRDFLVAERADGERLESTAIRFLTAIGAVSLNPDDKYKFTRLGYTIPSDHNYALPLIHWLSIKSLTEADIEAILSENKFASQGLGKVVRHGVSDVESELWQDPDSRRRNALHNIWTQSQRGQGTGFNSIRNQVK